MVTAFSRTGPKKVYVQHRLKERAKEVNELLEKKAYFYVCGDAANMAREVNAVLAQILADERGVSEAKAEEIVKNMRSANQYQVRGTPRPIIGRPITPSHSFFPPLFLPRPDRASLRCTLTHTFSSSQEDVWS